MSRNYYIVLGISRGADLEKIKRAYRTIAKSSHPDVSKSEETAQKFREARQAYEVLSDSEKRRQYDEELAREGSRVRVERVPEIVDRQRSAVSESMNANFTETDEFFDGFLAGLFDRHRGRSGKDLYYEAVLSPAEAVRGGLFPIAVPVLESCPRCRGTGWLGDLFCPSCLGRGRVRAEREFSLSIPPHVRDGTEIVLSLEDIGLRKTSIYIVVTIDPDQQDW
ncbi:MAG: DnaJ domain-containing protein [Desulfobacterales bacterium]|nr:DnaJ domain-containing protein [Desulfobacterales bacterium]